MSNSAAPSTSTPASGSSGKSLIPFRSVAARHVNSQYQVAYQPGGRLNVTLARQGYLSWLRLRVEGTMSVTTAGTFTDPWEAIDFFTFIGIRSPQGDYPISIGSRNLYNYNRRLKLATQDALPNGVTLQGITRPNAATVNPGATGSQTINVSYDIPIAQNLGQNFSTGMLLAQIANNDFTLQLNCNNAAGMIGAGSAVISDANTNLTIYIEAEWFELVDTNQVNGPNLYSSLKLRDSTYTAVANGDNYVSYQCGPILTDEMLLIKTSTVGDASRGANFPYIKKLINRSVEIRNQRGIDIYDDNFQYFAKEFPPGVFIYDWLDDLDTPNVTACRDFIDSNRAAQLDTVVNIGPAVSLVSPSITSVYRELVTLGS